MRLCTVCGLTPLLHYSPDILPPLPGYPRMIPALTRGEGGGAGGFVGSPWEIGLVSCWLCCGAEGMDSITATLRGTGPFAT